MEACTFPLRLRLPDYMNKSEFLGCNLNPVVVLTDFRKSPSEKLQKNPTTSPGKGKLESSRVHRVSSSGDLQKASKAAIKAKSTGTESDAALSSPQRFKSMKRKRESWDPSVEYEIEKIIGYHRDKRNKMWYLVKWKNWPDKHNTFEPIENLTGCYYELMKCFETVQPTSEALIEKSFQIDKGLRERSIYNRLRSNGYRAEELREFARQCPDARQLFDGRNLDELEGRIREDYEYIVRCLIAMYFHQDEGLVFRGQNHKLLLELIQLRRKQLQHNASAEKHINARETIKISIENNVDLDKFPNIDYIVELKPGPGVDLPREPLLGCECVDGCSWKSHCCGKMADSVFAYNQSGRLRVGQTFAIYECNSRCSCPASCPNRVVQRGRQVELCIFKTKSCGWGVKTLKKIPKGTFVCEYIGELIPDSEAVVRDTSYFREKKGYLFDLDFFLDAKLDMYCIDATEHGNVARFINHSCDPNLVVCPVWVDGLEPNLHRLAFFARRNIQKNEEIHFDYENLQNLTAEELQETKMSHGLRMVSNVRCQCKADNCREWVFGNK